MTTAFQGFLDGLGRWVGPKPPTAADIAAQEERAAVADAAERARQDAQRRPVNERIAALTAGVFASLPAPLVRAVQDTERERVRLAAKVTETQAELAALDEHPPSEADLDAWTERRMRLELALPHLRRMSADAHQAASAALTAARQALEPRADELHRTAMQGILRVQTENREREKDAERERGVCDAAAGRIRSLTAADLQ